MKSCNFRFNTSYTSLPVCFFSMTEPEPVVSPNVVILNEALAASMGLNFSGLTIHEQGALFSGNRLPEGSTPFSQAYAGHQFGHFTLLGDGRAHLWGEHVTPDGQRLDIQYKGSGRTPYSRQGDGKAVLGPMLREYIISEAMHYLGIPTTRSLAVATTGEAVMRQTMLPGAVLTRVARSHIRVGTFEFAATQQNKTVLGALMDYTIERHFPECLDQPNKALALLQAVLETQANLIVHWMRVGFIHGVMNTDNMALSGETIDYGPCAFMDTYDPHTVFSSIDRQGRYAYAHQPRVAQWNLARFAETLLPLIDEDEQRAIALAEETINQFPKLYQDKWLAMMRSKLGLFGKDSDDESLVFDLLDWMHKNQADYTNTFRDLSPLDQPFGTLYEQPQFNDWCRRWHVRLENNNAPLTLSISLMKQSNPVVIPRNHQVEQALEAADTGNLGPLYALLSVLREPYTQTDQTRPYQAPPEPSDRGYQTFCGT
ncbi:MAG: YdiU family protein [Cyanobacteria bacterium HKST-UBA04]|nr:YdiU family protein [Cyanobacteria bacterium HKST-UBA04]